MREITFLTDDELKSIIDGCVDGVYPTAQETAMANELKTARTKIKELESENQQTEMTTHEAQEYAWEMVKIDCGLHHVTVGELSVDYAFFLHGWNYATQYHKQTNKKIINEIKAQGIEEAIKGFRTFALSNNVNLTCEDFDEYLCEQANKLRTNHD